VGEDDGPVVVLVPSINVHVEVGSPVCPVEVSTFVPVKAIEVVSKGINDRVAVLIDVADFVSIFNEGKAISIFSFIAQEFSSLMLLGERENV